MLIRAFGLVILSAAGKNRASQNDIFFKNLFYD